jgi:hypothetical protein
VIINNDKYMTENLEFPIDTTKIGTDEGAKQFRTGVIEDALSSLEQKKAFGPGDLVTILGGPYAHQGLMVVEVREDGVTRIAPAPNFPTVEIQTDKLFHFDDYHDAFRKALIDEQVLGSRNPQ